MTASFSWLAPDPDLPLAVQLETALDSLKVQSQGARELKQKLDELHRVTDEAQRKLRESEAMVLAKDKIINDLRLQVPTSVDSAIVMATVTGHGGHMEADDYEARSGHQRNLCLFAFSWQNID